MSTSSLRALAVVVAVVIAVLTGIATGLLSGPATCTVEPVAAPPATATSPPSTGGGLGNAEPSRNSPPVQQAPAASGTQQTRTTCSTEVFAVQPALISFVGAVFVGAALLLLLLLASKRRPSAPVAAAGARGGQAEADRKALVAACIYVRDRVTSKALGDRLGAALREAGVTVLEPTGARFDPAHHEAGGSAPSNDPAKIGSIAAVEVPGYADRSGRILRAPVVTVYQSAAQTTGRPSAGNPHDRREQPR